MRDAKMTLWKVDEAARYLGIRPKTLYEWVRTGRVPHRKLGFNVRFDPEELREWTARQGGEQAGAKGDEPGRAEPAGAVGGEPARSREGAGGRESIRDLHRVAREAARELRRLETSVGAQLTFAERRALADLAERLDGAVDLTRDER